MSSSTPQDQDNLIKSTVTIPFFLFDFCVHNHPSFTSDILVYQDFINPSLSIADQCIRILLTHLCSLHLSLSGFHWLIVILDQFIRVLSTHLCPFHLSLSGFYRLTFAHFISVYQGFIDSPLSISSQFIRVLSTHLCPLQIIPAPQPMKTNSEGMADFGILSVSGPT